MAKYTSPSPTSWTHATDAGFRAWVIEFQNAMTGAGFVITADTGQINTTTVVRAAANTNAGYNMFAFNDSLQATAPIYIRVDYGTGSTTSTPRIQVSVANATDGAGGFAGTPIKTVARTVRDTATTTGAATYNSYAYHEEGVGWIVFKYGNIATAASFGFIVCRTCDSDMTPNGEGAVVLLASATGASTAEALMSQLRFAVTAAVITDNAASRWHVLPVGNPATSADGLTLQPYLWFANMPRVQPIFGLLSYIDTDIPSLTVFPAAPVGVADKDYLALRYSLGSGGQSGTLAMALIWE